MENEVKQFVANFMKTYEPDTFIPNKHGVYIYRSENLVSGINLVSFFEDLLNDYISALAENTPTSSEQLVAPPVSVTLPLTEARLCELHDIAKRYCYTTQDNSPTISRKGVELLILEIFKGN